jgi:hypothetical protein
MGEQEESELASDQHRHRGEHEPQRAPGRQGAQRQGEASTCEQQHQPRGVAQVLLGAAQRGNGERSRIGG